MLITTGLSFGKSTHWKPTFLTFSHQAVGLSQVTIFLSFPGVFLPLLLWKREGKRHDLPPLRGRTIVWWSYLIGQRVVLAFQGGKHRSRVNHVIGWYPWGLYPWCLYPWRLLVKTVYPPLDHTDFDCWHFLFITASTLVAPFLQPSQFLGCPYPEIAGNAPYDWLLLVTPFPAGLPFTPAISGA